MFACFVGIFVGYFVPPKKAGTVGRALGDRERLFLTLVVTVLGEENCRHCRKKQRKEGGLWEAAAPSGRALRGSESKGAVNRVLQGPEATVESSL